MIIAPNASIAQFATAYSGALSSLGIESAAQKLCYDGSIIFGSEAAEPADRPLINIDGSRSTDARDLYVRIDAPSDPVFMICTADGTEDVCFSTSSFLSEIDLLENFIDSKMIDVTQVLENEGIAAFPPGEMRVRDVLKTLSEHPIPRKLIEEMKETAHQTAHEPYYYAIPVDRFDDVGLAMLFFAIGAIFAGIGGEELMNNAAGMFMSSAAHFQSAGGHSVLKAVVAEIPAGLSKDEGIRNCYLVQVAELWDEAARILHKDGDMAGAIIAAYRGLRAAALSKNHEAMRRLFAISSEINGERGKRWEQICDYLRVAQAAFNTYIHGINSDEHLVWKEAYWGLRFAFGLMRDQEMIDAIRPFIVTTKERAGLG